MAYIDLAELDEIKSRIRGWSHRGPGLVGLRTEDHLDGKPGDFAESLRDIVERHGFARPEGPVRLLTHLRCFGHCFNPISVFYCYDRCGDTLETAVLEVTNTPWDERHYYVLDLQGGCTSIQFQKKFHVSPFMPMNMQYTAYLPPPDGRLSFALTNSEAGRTTHRATLVLEREALSNRTLWLAIARQPLATLRIKLAIYWQALGLWRAGASFYPHPNSESEGITR